MLCRLEIPIDCRKQIDRDFFLTLSSLKVAVLGLSHKEDMKRRKSMIKNKGITRVLSLVLLLSLLMLTACSEEAVVVSEVENDVTSESVERDEIYTNDMEADYETVFNQNEVLEFTIKISEEDWDLMQEDLSENLSSGKGKPGETSTDDYEPIWVEASVTFDGNTWEHVGIRYKGNSSLLSAVKSGNNKLSFKLDFDEFEDLYPETEDQRFYGFKQLNLNNNYSDTSLVHEKVAADLFSDFGLVSANTTFCIVNVDYGEGEQYFGVYTLVEEMDDTGISQFADDSGNLYKPDGDAASFAEGTYDEGEMELKTNEDEGDYSDVEALYEIINSDLRVSDPSSWKAALEEVFNVDGFLKWLAANTVIQNWDTYGNMTHNYYLYNDPETGQLNWLPWDNNEAFTEGKGNRGALSLGLDEVGDNWPLISYLMDEEEYQIIYEDYVEEFVDEVFTVERMTIIYDEYYELLKDYAYAEEDGYTFLNSDAAFDQGIETMKNQVVERNELVDDYFEN